MDAVFFYCSQRRGTIKNNLGNFTKVVGTGVYIVSSLKDS